MYGKSTGLQYMSCRHVVITYEVLDNRGHNMMSRKQLEKQRTVTRLQACLQRFDELYDVGPCKNRDSYPNHDQLGRK